MNTALAQLRAKTDRQLATLIRKEVERAKTEASHGNFSSAEKKIERAEAWLVVAGLTSGERSRVERSIQKVRASLQTPTAVCA